MKTYWFKAMLLSSALFGLGITWVYHYPGQQAPEIVNKTTAIQVVSVVRGETGYELGLKNVSQKNINGYSIGSENAFRTSDLTVGESVVAPGEEFSVHISQIRGPDHTQVAATTRPLMVRYVIFDDDSSDGDDIAAQELRDIRSGRLEQLQRIELTLNSTSSSLDLAQLESQLKALPTESLRTDRSFNIARGRLAAKQDILLELSKVDKNKLRAELLKLTEQNARSIARLTNSRNR